MHVYELIIPREQPTLALLFRRLSVRCRVRVEAATADTVTLRLEASDDAVDYIRRQLDVLGMDGAFTAAGA